MREQVAPSIRVDTVAHLEALAPNHRKGKHDRHRRVRQRTGTEHGTERPERLLDERSALGRGRDLTRRTIARLDYDAGFCQRRAEERAPRRWRLATEQEEGEPARITAERAVDLEAIHQIPHELRRVVGEAREVRRLCGAVDDQRIAVFLETADDLGVAARLL